MKNKQKAGIVGIITFIISSVSYYDFVGSGRFEAVVALLWAAALGYLVEKGVMSTYGDEE